MAKDWTRGRKWPVSGLALLAFLAVVDGSYGGYHNLGAFWKSKGGPTRIAVSGTNPLTLGVTCGTYTITTTNKEGVAKNATANITVNLTTSGTGTIYSDPGCTTSTATATVSQGSSTTTFYYKTSAFEAAYLKGADAAATLAPGGAYVDALRASSVEGTLDTSFNATGKITYNPNTGAEKGRGLALTPDGKLILAGYWGNDFNVARVLSSTGALDSTWNGGAWVTTDIVATADTLMSAAVQPDGKVVVVGYSNNNVSVVRYNTDGTLDTTFNTTGKLSLDIAGAADYGNSVAIAPNGKIVIGGATGAAPYDAFVARLNADGTLDTSFNTTGKRVLAVAGANGDTGRSVYVTPDRKVLLTGEYCSGGATTCDFLLVRLNEDGSYDTSFSTDGWNTAPLTAGAEDHAQSVTLMGDGRIVIAGQANGSADFGIARFNSDGSLDTTFNSTGYALVNVTSDDDGWSVAVQADNKVIAAGEVTGKDVGVIRMTEAGALDTSFNGTGNLTYNFSTQQDVGSRSVISPDGMSWVVGDNTTNVLGTQGNFDLSKIYIERKPGNTDPLYATFGSFLSAITTLDNERSAAAQSDGKLIIAGSGTPGANKDFMVSRLSVSGALDTSYNTTGKVTTDFNGGDDWAGGVALQSDDKAVAAGSIYVAAGNNDFGVARYTTAGALDTTFNSTGKVTTDFGGVDSAYTVQVQTDGKIIAAGETVGASTYGAVARYAANGSLDTSFGTGGKTTLNIASNVDRIYSAALQGDGKIVLAGQTDSGGATGADFLVVRLTSSGAYDNTFGTNGVVSVDIGSGADAAQSVAIQPDGKIVVAGYGIVSGNNDMAVIRLGANGSLDSSFGTSGVFKLDFFASDDRAYGVAVRPDGKIALGGRAKLGTYFQSAAVVLTSAGALDTGFNKSGKLSLRTGELDNLVQALFLQSDNKMVLIGDSNGKTNVVRVVP